MKTKSIIFTAALLLTGCASQSQVDQLTKQVNTLRTDVYNLQIQQRNDTQALQREVQKSRPIGFAILTANPIHKGRSLLAAFAPVMVLSSMADRQKFHGRFITAANNARSGLRPRFLWYR
jgi:murein lipoprotein